MTDTNLSEQTIDTPRISFTDATGAAKEIHCNILVGTDGAHAICTASIPGQHRVDNFVEYPFAWFGIPLTATCSWPGMPGAQCRRPERRV